MITPLANFQKIIPPGQRGFFLCLEGGEGVGKTTQIKALEQLFTTAGYEVVRTREPGSCPSALEIRKLLVEGATNRWDSTAETLLFYTARHENLRHVIRPALAAQKVVIADRFALSTLVYQSLRGVNLDFIKAVHHAVVGVTNPDLTLVLDAPVAVALKRSLRHDNQENRFELLGAEFHEKVRQGYLAGAQHAQYKNLAPEAAIIDAHQSPEQVTQALIQALERWAQQRLHLSA